MAHDSRWVSSVSIPISPVIYLVAILHILTIFKKQTAVDITLQLFPSELASHRIMRYFR